MDDPPLFNQPSPPGRVAVYDVATGVVRRIISGSAETIALNVTEEQAFLPLETPPVWSPGRQLRVVEGELVDEPQPEALDAMKARLLLLVDAEAERARLRFLTPGAAQALVYEQKRREAFLMEGNADPDPASFPMLAAEVGITASSLVEVGTAVRTMANAWLSAAAAIETLRLGAKVAISTATSTAELDGVTEIAWPAPS